MFIVRLTMSGMRTYKYVKDRRETPKWAANIERRRKLDDVAVIATRARGVYLSEPLPYLVLSPLPVESSGFQRRGYRLQAIVFS